MKMVGQNYGITDGPAPSQGLNLCLSYWCGWGDLNSHAHYRRWNLNPVRLPIPPHPRTREAERLSYLAYHRNRCLLPGSARSIGLSRDLPGERQCGRE